MTVKSTSPDVYTDLAGLTALKAKARDHAPDALDKAAKQFESIFVQMVLKSMRQASLGKGIFDSDKSDFYRELYDKQLSLHLSRESNLGLARLISRQLGRAETTADGSQKAGRGLEDYRAHPVRNLVSAQYSSPFKAGTWARVDGSRQERRSVQGPQFGSQQEFVNSLRPHALHAARQLGVHPGVLLAQAALESGWGKKSIKDREGHETYNFFAIKADSRWPGPSTEVATLEYDAGIARRQSARFRAYSGIAEGFQDYVDFIRNNPRYAHALRSQGDPKKYIVALQQAGYATDPDYAEKVLKIFRQKGFDEIGQEQS